MSQRGFPGEQGQPGKPGEEGKDSGEGGRGGEGGEGGVGGAGAPQGPGGGGGEGGIGGRGARGATGPQGARGPTGADGVQPKLRWAPAFGYLLLAVVLGFLIWRTSDLANDNRRLIAEVANTCTDPKASAALRHQWTRVADVIDAQQDGKVTPAIAEVVPNAKAGDKLTSDIARDAFVASYRLAINEAGPAPDCRGLVP
jgi:hypothetical protein